MLKQQQERFLPFALEARTPSDVGTEVFKVLLRNRTLTGCTIDGVIVAQAAMKEVPITEMRQTFPKRPKEAFYLSKGSVVTRRGIPIGALIGMKEFRERFAENEEKDTI